MYKRSVTLTRAILVRVMMWAPVMRRFTIPRAYAQASHQPHARTFHRPFTNSPTRESLGARSQPLYSAVVLTREPRELGS